LTHFAAVCYISPTLIYVDWMLTVLQPGLCT
jgi:hypothetical protein